MPGVEPCEALAEELIAFCGQSLSRQKVPRSIDFEAELPRLPTGKLAYDPRLIQAPVAIIRGNWDSLCTDADAAWLFDALSAAPIRRDVKIARAGHLMHLEEGRYALYRETEIFLQGRDEPGGS
jgi:pimeloyl-ACP methyl ester carboxylesterase